MFALLKRWKNKQMAFRAIAALAARITEAEQALAVTGAQWCEFAATDNTLQAAKDQLLRFLQRANIGFANPVDGNGFDWLKLAEEASAAWLRIDCPLRELLKSRHRPDPAKLRELGFPEDLVAEVRSQSV